MAFLPPLAFIILFNLALFHGGFAELIYEDGYTVTTVFDGNKIDININPYSVVPRSESHDLLLLDSLHSRFYTLSLPLSQESVVKNFAGNGMPGFSDGSADSAMFDKPRSFAMDFKGNVYVADRLNFAVRKISNSGVTTIAGGVSKTPGRTDGPGRNATFSTNFEFTFVEDMCALLILDHGHQLIRQINLKAEDCVHSNSGVGSTVTWPWVVAVAVSCLVVGLLIGFAIRPYIKLSEDLNLTNISKSWMSYLMNLGSQTRTLCSGTRSVVASLALKFPRRAFLLVCSHLSLMRSLVIKGVDSCSSTVDKNYVSLIDSDNSDSSECSSSQKYFDQMRDLISFDQNPSAPMVCGDVSKQEDVTVNDGDHRGQIQELMQANITNFAVDGCKSTTVVEGPFLGVSTLVKRR